MSGRLSISVAILKASWASLKMCEDEWMFFWMDSRTVSSLRLSPGEEGDKPTSYVGSFFFESNFRVRVVKELFRGCTIEMGFEPFH